MYKRQLLDRYHSHTINCKSCSKALATIGGARKALRALTFIALAAAVAAFARTAPNKYTIALTALSAAAALVREKLGAFALKMKIGPYPPPRRPPSMMEDSLRKARLLNL